jgi:NAD(P)-dependent dehydrogenase (short-subunit alcohol dehydrogenase family)
MTFTGQVAFITGGGGGMGRLASRNLAESGKTVVALDVNEAGLDRDRFWVFPGRGTSVLWRIRRFLPKAVWRQTHRVEGF